MYGMALVVYQYSVIIELRMYDVALIVYLYSVYRITAYV